MLKKKILVINCGSSSIKYKLYEFPSEKFLTKGLIEKIGEPGSAITSPQEGIEVLFDRLLRDKVIKSLEEIYAVGHRVVHGGEFFKTPCIINNEVISRISECSILAPLHNLANLAGIKGCIKVLPNVPQVAVFDTVFHQTIKEEVYLYPIPMDYYKKYGIRKYGFHGTSHQFVAEKAAGILNKPLNKLKLITCHLGNGCSITAIDKGQSVDTSMGFTPLEGIMMGTRCGNIDVAAVFYIMDKEKLSLKEMEDILNKKSGLLGVSGLSNDMRVIKKEAKKNKFADLALKMFIYRIEKYIGAYYFLLSGVDAICFTGGIGENNDDLIDIFKKRIYKVASKKTKVLVIPTDEELMIGQLTHDLINQQK